MHRKQNHWTEQNEGYQEPFSGGVTGQDSNCSHLKWEEVQAVNTDALVQSLALTK